MSRGFSELGKLTLGDVLCLNSNETVFINGNSFRCDLFIHTLSDNDFELIFGQTKKDVDDFLVETNCEIKDLRENTFKNINELSIDNIVAFIGPHLVSFIIKRKMYFIQRDKFEAFIYSLTGERLLC